MNSPNNLFAFRKVFFEGCWHIRCINCGGTAAKSWDSSDKWSLFNATAQPITVSLPVEEFETSGIPLGPAVVYGRDAAIESLASSERTLAIVAQNHVVFVTNCDLGELEMPVFLRKGRSETIQSEVAIDFSSPFLDDLLDVQVYQKRRSPNSDVVAEFERFGSTEFSKARIPVEFYLPATVQVSGGTQTAIYEIKEWRSDNTAKANLFTSSKLTLGQKGILVRELSGSPIAILGSFTVV